MSHNNLKAFEYAKEITVAKMTNSTMTANESGGKCVADFFEEIFNKLVELEDKAQKN